MGRFILSKEFWNDFDQISTMSSVAFILPFELACRCVEDLFICIWLLMNWQESDIYLSKGSGNELAGHRLLPRLF